MCETVALMFDFYKEKKAFVWSLSCVSYGLDHISLVRSTEPVVVLCVLSLANSAFIN